MPSSRRESGFREPDYYIDSRSRSSGSSRDSRQYRPSRPSNDPRRQDMPRKSNSTGGSRSGGRGGGRGSGRGAGPANNGSQRQYNSKANNKRLVPADPRPSRADPDERTHRKGKEKECGGFDWEDGLVLALTGAFAVFSIDKALDSHDESSHGKKK